MRSDLVMMIPFTVFLFSTCKLTTVEGRLETGRELYQDFPSSSCRGEWGGDSSVGTSPTHSVEINDYNDSPRRSSVDFDTLGHSIKYINTPTPTRHSMEFSSPEHSIDLSGHETLEIYHHHHEEETNNYVVRKSDATTSYRVETPNEPEAGGSGVGTREKVSKPECTICLQPFEEEQLETKYLQDCGHQYHTTCLTEWLMKQPNCPLCRGGLKADELLSFNIAPPTDLAVVIPPPTSIVPCSFHIILLSITLFCVGLIALGFKVLSHDLH